MDTKRIKLSKKAKINLIAWGLMTPALFFMLIFTVYPVFRSLYLSFSKFKIGMDSPEFIGLQNYIALSGNKVFWKVMGNSIKFSLLTVIPSMIVGIGLALLVNRKGKKVGFIRTAYFYPVVMPMIAVASVWMFIYMAKNGLFDQMLIRIGLEPMNVLSNKKTVLPFMAVMYLWKEAGYLMVFFLSGMQNISEEIYEAATIDGARAATIFRKITLPLLGPTILFVSIIAFTNSFKLVDHVVIMTEGAPNNASTLLLYYLYQQGFTNFNYGISAALTVIMLVILLIISLPRFMQQDKKVHYN
jgi:sn-glycerol 3-phosphate transport system permease protein